MLKKKTPPPVKSGIRSRILHPTRCFTGLQFGLLNGTKIFREGHQDKS